MHFPWSIIAFAGRSTARTPVLCWGGFSHLENRVAWEKFSNRLQDPSCETIPPGLGGGFPPPQLQGPPSSLASPPPGRASPGCNSGGQLQRKSLRRAEAGNSACLAAARVPSPLQRLPSTTEVWQGWTPFAQSLPMRRRRKSTI